MTIDSSATDQPLPAASTDPPIASPGTPAGVPLMDPEEWRTQRAPQVFRSADSLRWFVRHNREELINDGALVAPAGRFLVHVDRMEASVMQIGQRLARSLRR